MHLKHTCLPISPPEHGMLKTGHSILFPAEKCKGDFHILSKYFQRPLLHTLKPPLRHTHPRRNQEPRFPNPDSRFDPNRAENGAKEILACFLKKTGQVLKKTSSASKETGVLRWDQNDLPVGPQRPSGGIGKPQR